MPKQVRAPLARNAKVIAAAMRGDRAVHRIDGVKGLHLEVLGGGRASWRLRYQPAKDKGQRWMTLGDARSLEFGKVMERAYELMGQLRLNGIDPKRVEPTPLAPPTLNDVFVAWLGRPSRKRALRDRTREHYEQVFRRHVQPRLGRTLITMISATDIKAATEDIRLATTNAERGYRGTQATKALKIIHSVCAYACEVNLIDRNPARGIAPPVPIENPTGKQHRPPTDKELSALWNEAPRHMNAQSVRLVRLAMLVGKRVSEMVEARKTELVLDRQPHWFIPGTRTGNKSGEDQIVPLAPLACWILKEACADSPSSPFIFQARSLDHKPMSRHTPSQAFLELRRAVGIEDRVRFHDARGLINDQMSKLRVPREYRSHILHHTGDMRATLADATYSTYDFSDEKRRALRLWSLRLQEIVRGRKPRGLRW
jgi:Phage integrase family